MSKNLVLMRDVICVYHPKFIENPLLRNIGIADPNFFNVERLVEECLAAIGPYDFIDAAGYDYTDFSDSKTTTVIPDGKSKSAVVNGVENKIGGLRITIYNPFKNCVDFMYIPHKQVQLLKEPCYGRSGGSKEKLRIRWNQKNDHYNSFTRFQLKTFEDLALAK